MIFFNTISILTEDWGDRRWLLIVLLLPKYFFHDAKLQILYNFCFSSNSISFTGTKTPKRGKNMWECTTTSSMPVAMWKSSRACMFRVNVSQSIAAEIKLRIQISFSLQNSLSWLASQRSFDFQCLNSKTSRMKEAMIQISRLLVFGAVNFKLWQPATFPL